MKFWQALFGPWSAIVNGWLKSKAKTKAVESWTKAAKAEAETEVMQVAAIIPFLGGLVALAGFVVWFIVVFQLKNSANDIINHKMKLEQTGNPPVRSHFEIQN